MKAQLHANGDLNGELVIALTSDTIQVLTELHRIDNIALRVVDVHVEALTRRVIVIALEINPQLIGDGPSMCLVSNYFALNHGPEAVYD